MMYSPSFRFSAICLGGYTNLFLLILIVSLLILPLKAGMVPVLIPVGESIQEYLESHPQSDRFELDSGVYPGKIIIDRPLELKGNGGSIIRSAGQGTTIRISSPRVKLQSVIIDGSGIRYDQKDAAVLITADRVAVIDNVVTNATFGILSEKANGVKIIGNIVYGNSQAPLGLRGDGIRIWETRDSHILSNELRNSRDMVVWYASSNEFGYNHISGGRYGVHFMYSHYNRIHHNEFINNVVGSFIMYSHNILAFKNLFAGTTGPSGYGLGVKESGNLHFISNAFVNNTVGIYSDNAPYDDRDKNVFDYNLITLSQTGIEFHGKPQKNIFSYNTLKRNRTQVEVTGSASADGIVWKRNYYDDYQGYDLDKDSIGDLRYEYRKLMNDLTDKYPSLSFFDGTMVYYLVNLIGEALPLLKPRLIMSDDQPLVSPLPTPIERL